MAPSRLTSRMKSAFVLAPHDVDGSELLPGFQHPYPEQGRAGWDALWEDKQQLHMVMKQGNDDWSTIVRSVMDTVPLDTLSI